MFMNAIYAYILEHGSIDIDAYNQIRSIFYEYRKPDDEDEPSKNKKRTGVKGEIDRMIGAVEEKKTITGLFEPYCTAVRQYYMGYEKNSTDRRIDKIIWDELDVKPGIKQRGSYRHDMGRTGHLMTRDQRDSANQKLYDSMPRELSYTSYWAPTDAVRKAMTNEIVASVRGVLNDLAERLPGLSQADGERLKKTLTNKEVSQSALDELWSIAGRADKNMDDNVKEMTTKVDSFKQVLSNAAKKYANIARKALNKTRAAST